MNLKELSQEAITTYFVKTAATKNEKEDPMDRHARRVGGAVGANVGATVP